MLSLFSHSINMMSFILFIGNNYKYNLTFCSINQKRRRRRYKNHLTLKIVSVQKKKKNEIL